MPSLRVLNHSFEVELPYADGSVMTSAEASELNRLRVARIAERARSIINSRGPGADPEEVRKELEIMASSFRFLAAPYTLPPDAAELEAKKIAKAIVTERLARTKVEISKEELELAIASIAGEPRVRAEASRRVELAKRVTVDALGDLDKLLAKKETE